MKSIIFSALFFGAFNTYAADRVPLPSNPVIVSCTVSESLGARNARQTTTLRSEEVKDLQLTLFPKLVIQLEVNPEHTDVYGIVMTAIDGAIKNPKNFGESWLAELTGFDRIDTQFKVGESADHNVHVLCTRI